jgi:ubiquinone/menaquinone biosynthesis C-methylase UbiE
MAEQTVDLEAIKGIQQKVWSTGDFSVVAQSVQVVSDELVESLDIMPGEKVIDVACGSGNCAIPAARRAWGNTVGVDYVPELLERGRERAAAERLEIEFIEGDAENLPFEDATFDVVVTTFGSMFAPNQEKAAAELLRVCKPGGRIGMANWTPEGVTGNMFQINAKHAPPPPGAPSPLTWGKEEQLREWFGDEVSSLEVNRKQCIFRFRSPDHWLEVFRTYFGPVNKAFERVGPEGEEALAADLRQMLEDANDAGDRGLRFGGEYLEVIATRA